MTDSPITDATRDRFLREVTAHSGADGISSADIEDALLKFIEMNIDAAALALWFDGRLELGWRDGQMIYHLVDATRGHDEKPA